MKVLSLVETPWTAEPQTAFEKSLVLKLDLLTSDVVVQFQDYAGSPGGRVCRFQSSNVFESGTKLCAYLQQQGFERVLEQEPVATRSRQMVSVQYQRGSTAVWLIAHPISVSIVVFEGLGA